MKCKKCGVELLFENQAHGIPMCQGNLSDGAKDEIYTKAINWILSDDTGISSKVIWGVMMKAEKYYRSYTPSDPSDFGRCYRLLKLIPEWEERLEELRVAGEKWGVFVDNYKKMCELYELEKESGQCRKLYDFMQEIL